ncbi:hypothetical protein ILYODFUR_034433 [Ilyodon furcidens]|uniref:Uncharacterized protein n=1 Tax=Ilyodon furcidens TaxID=33524 RepID=A0ABV0UYJ3_9TELE
MFDSGSHSSQVVSMTVDMFVLLSVCLSTCVAFNVDMSFPVLKTIGSKSLFGFSVALHEDLETGNFLLRKPQQPKQSGAEEGSFWTTISDQKRWD